MIDINDLSYLRRSGSWRFMRDARARTDDNQENALSIGQLSWNGHPVYYRARTSDCFVIHEVLLRPTYAVPAALSPRTVLDIGGNIGAASLYFARQFPSATIHTFEPVPANMELLRKNVAPYPQIKAHPIALGGENGDLTLFASDNRDNFGGFSFFDKGVDPERRMRVPMRHAQEYLDEQGILAPDVIKIDTEGSEYTILKALRPEVLARVQWIIGELHGEKDFDLLAYLTQWFHIGTSKAIDSRLFTFNACNVSVVQAIGH
jgi:FkbM family methyltransferase